jgi:hypothetical protein
MMGQTIIHQIDVLHNKFLQRTQQSWAAEERRYGALNFASVVMSKFSRSQVDEC